MERIKINRNNNNFEMNVQTFNTFSVYIVVFSFMKKQKIKEKEQKYPSMCDSNVLFDI